MSPEAGGMSFGPMLCWRKSAAPAIPANTVAVG